MQWLTEPPTQLKHFGKLPVIGGSKCQAVTKTPKHGETFKIGERISVKALHTPCHTQDSICYFMEDGDQRVVFTGDTLFIAGVSDSDARKWFGSYNADTNHHQAADVSSKATRPRCTRR